MSAVLRFQPIRPRSRLVVASAIVTCALFSAKARAADRADCSIVSCVDFGVRVGYGLGFGSITEGEVLSDRTGGLVALGLDAGYRIAGFMTVGGDVTMSRVFLKKSSLAGAAVTGDGPCFEGTSCSASLYRFGLDVRFHLLPHSAFDPWIGLGAGYEILTVSESGQTPAPQGPVTFDAVEVSLRGMEYGRIEVGGDARVAPWLSVGPFAAFSLARYGSSRASGAISVGDETIHLDAKSSREIVTTSFHEWLIIGARASFELSFSGGQ